MNRFLLNLLVTAFIAGTLDIIGAFILQYTRSGKLSIKLLNYIAGGWLGPQDALKGGTGTAVLGLLSHYFIATCFVAIFLLAYPRRKFMQFNPVVVGLLYGLFIDLVMSRIVVPLSALGTRAPFNWNHYLINALVVGIAIGITSAISAKRYYASRDLSSAPINLK